MAKTIIKETPRSAVNGRYVTKEYAAKHPKTTVIEHRKVTKK